MEPAAAPAELIEWSIRLGDIFTIIAILAGPLAAVWITFAVQSRRDHRAAKMHTFLTLLSERKKLYTPAGVDALNTIDVVFADNQKVLNLWHKYYGLLLFPANEERGHTWLEMLQEMAFDLNYPRLTQTTLDKFYMPQGHVDDYQRQQRLTEALLRVLEQTEKVLLVPKDKETPKT